jgi:CutC family
MIDTGCDRLLTSAQSNSALSGAVQLKELVAVAGDRIQVIAASGIGADNAFEIIMKSRVSGIHAGSSVHEINIPVTDHDDEAGTSDVGLSVYNPSDAATIEGVDQENERPPRSVISGLSESFECVSTTRVQKLASVANTAWLLLSLEKGDPPVDSPPAITALEVLCTAPSNEEKEDYGIISKATSADFSDDAFIELNPSKASIETSYVHVDSKLESKKKQSWFSYGGIGL